MFQVSGNNQDLIIGIVLITTGSTFLISLICLGVIVLSVYCVCCRRRFNQSWRKFGRNDIQPLYEVIPQSQLLTVENNTLYRQATLNIFQASKFFFHLSKVLFKKKKKKNWH